MDENINLAKILKECPKDWSLYSPVCGYVHFVEIAAYDNIIVVDRSGNTLRFMSNGMYRQNGECLLFPSYSNRDWSNFSAPWYQPNQQNENKNGKFDPKTFKPFDKVIVKNDDDITWVAALFSHIIIIHHEVTGIDYLEYVTSYYTTSFCVPYNDETKHLIGTTVEAPKYYRHWEE